MRRSKILSIVLVMITLAIFYNVSSTEESESEKKNLVVYSGRSEELVSEVIKKFTEKTGINVEVKYGDTSQLAATILEESNNSPADVFFAQDAGALGVLESNDLFEKLSEDITSKVDSKFHSNQLMWVGVSGRARVVVYNSDILNESDLPDDVFGFCDAKWRGKIGWAPTNASFQSFITAMRIIDGEEKTKEWLTCIKNNNPQTYPKNGPIVEAVSKNEVQVGFVNHYYLYQFNKELGELFPVRNYFPRNASAGSMINVAGVGMLKNTKNKDNAEKFIDYLLNEEAQQYFSQQTNEYTLVKDVPQNQKLKPINEIAQPDIDLTKLEDLEKTLELLKEMELL